jgi:hypothetical protein
MSVIAFMPVGPSAICDGNHEMTVSAVEDGCGCGGLSSHCNATGTARQVSAL